MPVRAEIVPIPGTLQGEHCAIFAEWMRRQCAPMNGAHLRVLALIWGVVLIEPDATKVFIVSGNGGTRVLQAHNIGRIVK